MESLNNVGLTLRGRTMMKKYKYWSTEKLLKLMQEINWRINNTSYGVSDIYFRNAIEDIVNRRVNR